MELWAWTTRAPDGSEGILMERGEHPSVFTMLIGYDRETVELWREQAEQAAVTLRQPVRMRRWTESAVVETIPGPRPDS